MFSFLLIDALPTPSDLSEELSLDVKQDLILMILTSLKWSSVVGLLLPLQFLVLLFKAP